MYVNIGLALLAMLLFLLVVFQQYKIIKLKNDAYTINDVNKALYNMAEKVSKAEDEEEVYSIVLETAISLIPGATKGSILMLEEDGLFHYRALKGFSSKVKDLTLIKEEVFLNRINNFSDTAIIINPSKFDENLIDKHKFNKFTEYEALDISCCISSPIFFNREVLGVINVDSVNRNKIFDKEDMELMNYIKNELQLVLYNFVSKNKLKYMANFDELTGLYNRRNFKYIFNLELHNIKRNNSKFCLALIDLDDFKEINDTYGHNMGDKALQYFADVLRSNVRKTDVYARMSGDEFVILFLDCYKGKALERMETLKTELRNITFENLKISFSYGVTYIDGDSKLSADDIFSMADQNMYKQKKIKNDKSCITY